MAKTLKNIWQQLTSFENLVAAWEEAKRGKRYCLS